MYFLRVRFTNHRTKLLKETLDYLLFFFFCLQISTNYFIGNNVSDLWRKKELFGSV